MSINQLSVTLAFALMLNLGCGTTKQEQTKSPDADTAINDDVMSFSNGTLHIAGNAHQFPFHLADLVESIGQPDRTSELANVLYTWDQLGIVAYQHRSGGPINSVTISFSDGEYDFSPQKPFQGTFKYRGADLTKNSTVAELKSVGLEQDDLLPNLYIATHPGFSIISDFDAKLVEFSITADTVPEGVELVFFANSPVQFEIPSSYHVDSGSNETVVITPEGDQGVVLRLNLHSLPTESAEEFVQVQAEKKGLEVKIIGDKAALTENEEASVDGKQYDMIFWQIGFGDSLVVLSAEVDPEKKENKAVKDCLQLIPSLIKSLRKK